MKSHINIGIRHFLPAFPFLFILGGAFLDWLLRRRRAAQVALMVVVLLTGRSLDEAQSIHKLLLKLSRLRRNHKIKKAVYQSFFRAGRIRGGMITSLKTMTVSFCCGLRKTGFQFGSVRNFDPSSPRAAGVRSECTACAIENAGPSADTALANSAARIRSRRLIKGAEDRGFGGEEVASRPELSIAQNHNSYCTCSSIE